MRRYFCLKHSFPKNYINLPNIYILPLLISEENFEKLMPIVRDNIEAMSADRFAELAKEYLSDKPCVFKTIKKELVDLSNDEYIGNALREQVFKFIKNHNIA